MWGDRDAPHGLPLGTKLTFDAYVNPDEGNSQFLWTDKLDEFLGERVRVTVEVIEQPKPFESKINRSPE